MNRTERDYLEIDRESGVSKVTQFETVVTHRAVFDTNKVGLLSSLVGALLFHILPVRTNLASDLKIHCYDKQV